MDTTISMSSDRLAWAAEYLKPYGNCPLCASKDRNPLYTLGILKIYKCRACSLMFLNPCLMPEEQKMIFSSPEFLTRVSGFLADYHNDSSWVTPKTAAIYESALISTESLLPSKGRILDVGCGKGSFLTIAKSRGWNACGLEPNFSAVEHLKTQGIEAYSEDFFKVPFPEASFDVISLWDLIEHTPDPANWMKRCKKLLKPGGLLMIATPNHYSLLDFIAFISYKLTGGVFRSAASKLYTIDHTLYLTHKTLGQLYRKCGFEPLKTIRVNTDLSRYTMSAGFRLFSETLLALSSLLGLQNRVIMIGRK